MKNIFLLDTSVGSLNQGDEIINISIKKNWPELFENNYIMSMATHTPMYTALQSLIYRNKLNVFKNADYKFLCGTNALYTNMLRPLPTWNINLINCGLAKGTICLGVGIGVNSKAVNWYTKALYKKILNKEYIHSVRDNKTKKFLQDLGYKAENTGCPTLWGLTSEHCKLIPNHKGSRVIFTLTYYEQDPKNDKALVETLLRNYSKVYFWPQCIKDVDYLKKIYDVSRIHIIPPNIAGYEKVLNMSGTDYVGNRLHGGIFALQHKCRTIIISIDYRAKEMAESYSFKCIDRKDTYLLEELLNLSWNTEIKGLNFEKIEMWKRQFK